MTRLIGGVRNLTNEERLNRLNVHSLERRRLRGDLIEVFKWFKGINKGDIAKVLKVEEQGRTRTHGYKLDKFRCRREVGKNWFTNTVVDECNKLSVNMMNAETIDSLKTRLDEFMDNEGRW